MSCGITLLVGLVAKGEIDAYNKLSAKMFFGPELDLFNYIDGHAKKHGTLPKPETLAAQFAALPHATESVAYYLDQVKQRLKHKTLNVALTGCNELMKKQDADAAIALVRKALDDLQTDDLSGTDHKPLGQFVMSAPELLAKELPLRQSIVEPFLPTASLSMLFAERGTGKSWFALWLALSVASGECFFEWDVPEARPVLYVDGEMPLQDIQRRLLTLCPKPPANLRLLPSESLWREGKPLNLNLPEHQARIDHYLATVEQKPALIVMDNLSSLCAGIDENSNSDLDGLLRWLIKLRSQGFAVLLVHHAGKNGQQRGASRREDLLDTSIRLTETAPTHGSGACFTVTFTKVRGKKPDPLALKVELDTEGIVAKWHTSASDGTAPAWLHALRIIRDEAPENQKQLAEKLGITASAVSQQLTSARKKGLLHAEKLELTKSGMALVEQHWPKELVDALG